MSDTTDMAEVLIAMAETDARLTEYVRAAERERDLVRKFIGEHQPLILERATKA